MPGRKHNKVQMPHLSALKAFEVSARHESLVKAAEELHVTQGAISKQVKNLEAELGAELFVRRNRSVFLSEKGRWLSQRLGPIFSNLEDVIEDFHSMDVQTPLVVSCEPTVCLRLLIPEIDELKKATGLVVRVLAAGGKIDFRRDRVDIAIRRNDFPIDDDIFTLEIAKEAVGPVHAPELSLSKTNDQYNIPMIHAATRPKAWQAWGRDSGIPIHCTDDVSYEHFYLALEAASAAQGVAMASVHMVAGDIENGRLVAPFGFHLDGSHYICLSKTEFNQDPRKMMFMDWIMKKMAHNLRSLTYCESSASYKKAL